MLPNHAPLKVAENFRTLEALFPGRIDLGLGRAPGTDPRTAVALRGTREALRADDFPQQLQELTDLLQDDDSPSRAVRAMPAGTAMPELWLLGSSDFSARLAAERGLGFAFAHHINQDYAVPALRYYKENFRPSKYFAEPSSIIAVSAICAPTDAEAEALARPAGLVWLRFQQGRFRDPLPSVEEASTYPYSEIELEFLASTRGRLFVGSPDTVRSSLLELARIAGADEIMVTSLIHNPAARQQSYALLAQSFGLKQSA